MPSELKTTARGLYLLATRLLPAEQTASIDRAIEKVQLMVGRGEQWLEGVDSGLELRLRGRAIPQRLACRLRLPPPPPLGALQPPPPPPPPSRG